MVEVFKVSPSGWYCELKSQGEWTRCWPSGLDGASWEEWGRGMGFQVTSTPHPLQRAFMRPARCLSQHSNSKFLRGLWTGWQWVTAATKSFIQQVWTLAHARLHICAYTLKPACTHTLVHARHSQIHSVSTHISLREEECKKAELLFLVILAWGHISWKMNLQYSI